MSYHIYTTSGIVLKKTNFGEANSLFYILTEDFGMIKASAQGIRLQASKLRSSLQEFSLVTLSCVKGKNGWKITNSVYINNFFFEKPYFIRKILGNLSKVLIRMLPEEENNQDVFRVVLNAFSNLDKVNEININCFEIICNLKILYYLGYLDKDSYTAFFIENDDSWNQFFIDKVEINKRVLVGYINKGLKESHL